MFKKIKESKFLNHIKKMKESVSKRIKQIFKKKQLVETTITVKTKYLQKEIKNLYSISIRASVLVLFGSIVTGIGNIRNSGGKVLDYLNNINNSDNSISFPVIEVIVLGFSILILLLAFINFWKQFTVYDYTKFVNKITSEQYEKEQFTAIVIIKNMVGNTPKMLVTKSKSWNSLFLPYCHYNNQLSPDDIKESIKQPIAEKLEVDKNDFELFDDFSESTAIRIKRNPSQNEDVKINYRFYYLVFNHATAGQKFLNKNLQDFYWKSISELREDSKTQMNNGDVISIIDDISLDAQSKTAFPERLNSSYDIVSDYNIIWNITNSCFYNCSICATNSSNQNECEGISEDDKKRILFNLATINDHIKKLDISGGDPLKSIEDRNVIRDAVHILPYTDISVTTTGHALEKIPASELCSLPKKFDITYDIPYEISLDQIPPYREYHYNLHNFKQIEIMSKSGWNIDLNIHIPVLPKVATKELIEMILKDIANINPSEVKFIRLMPVGRMGNDQNYAEIEKYSPSTFINIVNDLMKQNEQYRFRVSYNCSLGSIVKKNESEKPVKNCRMLTEKLGIDYKGNVYACIWGAYVNFGLENEKENPFYLGSLLEESMYDILTSHKVTQLKERWKERGDGCRVCAIAQYIRTQGADLDKKALMEHLLSEKDPIDPFVVK